MQAKLLGILVLVAALVGAGVAAAGPQASAADRQILSQIEQRLFDAGLVTVKVAVEDGRVTLSGRVEDLNAKAQAVKEARKVKGVKDVVSTLTVRLPESDTDLASSVSNELAGSTFLTIFDEVGGTVRGGVATLTGFVTAPDKAKRAAEEVADVPGVQQVVNQIEVLPASTFDDQIRVDVADRIYNSVALSTVANPNARPIHIIVNGGHVRLVGRVSTEMDRKLAAILARQVPGVRDVDNALTVG
jgi:hyperosmotically inducible protein